MNTQGPAVERDGTQVVGALLHSSTGQPVLAWSLQPGTLLLEMNGEPLAALEIDAVDTLWDLTNHVLSCASGEEDSETETGFQGDNGGFIAGEVDKSLYVDFAEETFVETEAEIDAEEIDAEEIEGGVLGSFESEGIFDDDTEGNYDTWREFQKQHFFAASTKAEHYADAAADAPVSLVPANAALSSAFSRIAANHLQLIAVEDARKMMQ